MKPYYENKPERLDVSQSSLKYFPPHLHINMELMYIKNGTSKIKVDAKEYEVSAGDLVVVFPNVIHSYENETEENFATFVIFNSEFFDESTSTFINYEAVNPIIKAELIHDDVRYAIESLFKEKDTTDLNVAASRSLIHLILSRILPIIELEKTKYNKSANITSEIIVYVCDHFTEQITLDHLAETFGLNKYYISKLFSNKIKISLTDYTNNLRIQMAKKLLKSNNSLSILQISEQCGFETQRSFNRVFKSLCEVSPREYRSLSK
ncbi:MAG: AraC family transcriptional regulator [Clostridia bacterium]